jgi:hypothetical protein
MLVELTDQNAPEFFRGGEVAGAGFVLKSVAEDNGAFGHTRICRKASWGILDNNESGDVTRHDFQERGPKSAFLVNSPVGGKNTLDAAAAGELPHSMSRDYAQWRAAPIPKI